MEVYSARQHGVPRRFFFTLLVASAALAGLTGCALRGGGSPEFRLPTSELSSDSLIAIVNRQALATGAIKGSGKLRLSTPEFPGGRQLDMSLVARRPDQVRIRGRVGMLASIFDFSADSDSLHLFLPREGVLTSQANRPGTQSLSLVASKELVEAILPPPIDRGAPGLSPDVVRVAEGWLVSCQRGEGESVQVMTRLYDKDRLRLLSLTIRPFGVPEAEPLVRILYDKHAWTGQTWFPGSITLELPEESRRVTLSFLTFEPNPMLDRNIFQMSVPTGTRRVDPEDLDDDFLRSAPPAN